MQVHVRAPFFQGRDVTVSISACDADSAGANPAALTIFRWAEVDRLSSSKEGVPCVAKALAVRVRFPAWSASVRSRHLPIIFSEAQVRLPSGKTASAVSVQTADIPVVQL